MTWFLVSDLADRYNPDSDRVVRRNLDSDQTPSNVNPPSGSTLRPRQNQSLPKPTPTPDRTEPGGVGVDSGGEGTVVSVGGLAQVEGVDSDVRDRFGV